MRYDGRVNERVGMLKKMKRLERLKKLRTIVSAQLLSALLAACAPSAYGTVLVPLSTLNPPAYAATHAAVAAPAPATPAPPTPANVLLPAVRTGETSAAATAPVDAYPAYVATEWFKLLVQLTRRSPGFSPPVAARAFGYAGVTLYEALAPGMPGYQSLSGQLSDMPVMPQPPANVALYWPAVANAAMAQIARQLFPTITDTPLRLINKLERRIDAEFAGEAEADVIAASLAYGSSVADAVYAWSRSDGGDAGYMHNVAADYVQPTGTGLWQPTPPDYAPSLQPTWGDNRPLAPVGTQACAAPPPPEYSTDATSAFYREAREVYETVRRLTPEQEMIARYWSDDAGATATPPGHSLSIATQLLAGEESTLAQAALLYAKLGIALNDAFVTCWQTKYIYNVVRPITYIQAQIDPNWNEPEPTDPVRTPNFPEYTSGHSVASRAAAEVLTEAFGDNFRFTDITHVDRGIAPRTYSSFYSAAAEAAISRLYGGIHYRSAIESGLAQGACVGRRVLALQFQSP